MRYLYIILLFNICTISVNLHADVIECEIKEKTGTAKVLDITSEKFLQPVLEELENYQVVPLKSCNVGYAAEVFRKSHNDYSKFLSKSIFFLEDMTVMVNNYHSDLSHIHTLTKNKESNNKYSEINLYVRSESEDKYTHLLNAITDSSKLVTRYTHGEANNLKFESRYILLSWRFIDKDKKVNINNIPKNILFFTYKGLPLPNYL